LSKSDLVGAEELQGLIDRVRDSGIGVPVVALSNLTAAGRDPLLAMLEPRRTYCLLGSSGVGKTTLLNRLIGREAFDTGAVREKDGRGRHTTSRRQLILLDTGAMLIDTPGMKELGIIAASAGIEESFEDIALLAKGCRYSDCSHAGEAGCAVAAAVAAGELPEDRYQSYLKVSKESEFHELSYVQRRKKDKEFGKFVKSVLKTHRKSDPREG
jgi:ribosome biogenesis GTPase